MKKYILSALAGAMVMLIAIAVMATIHAKKRSTQRSTNT